MKDVLDKDDEVSSQNEQVTRIIIYLSYKECEFGWFLKRGILNRKSVFVFDCELFWCLLGWKVKLKTIEILGGERENKVWGLLEVWKRQRQPHVLE